MLPNPQFSADLVTFTEEILHGKLHFLCSGYFTSTALLRHLSAMGVAATVTVRETEWKTLHYKIW